MKFEFLTMKTAKGNLHGMQIGAEGDLALHFHGTWGNFYENPFVTALAQTYGDCGWRYASVNLPSHDGGSIDEELSDSLDAIQAWIERLARPGSKIIVQAHSLGAIKVIRALHDNLLSNVGGNIVGGVLLAPFDVVAFNGGHSDEAVRSNRERVKESMIVDANALVPRDVFSHWPLSAKTYLALTESGGAWDVFPSREDQHAEWLASCRLPLFVAIGENDFSAFPSAEAVISSLNERESIYPHLIPQAPHNFAGQESYLENRLSDFIRRLK